MQSLLKFQRIFWGRGRNGKANPQIHIELQRTENSENNIKKKWEDSHFPNLLLQNVLQSNSNQIQHGSINIKTNAIELRVQKCIYKPVVNGFLTRVPRPFNGGRNKWCWIFTCKRIKLDPYLTPHTKTSSKCKKDLNKS